MALPATPELAVIIAIYLLGMAGIVYPRIPNNLNHILATCPRKFLALLLKVISQERNTLHIT